MDATALVALIAALFGGAGLKLIETVLNKGKRKDDLAQQIREELREDVKDLRDTVSDVQQGIDMWRTRYYHLLEAYNILKYRLLQEGVDLDEIPGPEDIPLN